MTASTPSIPTAHSDAAPEKPRRLALVRRIRLSTLLLSIVVAALLIGLYVQRRRETQILARLSLYRNTKQQEGIYDSLEEPIALTYPDGAPLDDVLKEIKKQTTKNPKLPTGNWIYVDLIGLQEAEVSLDSPVKRPQAADKLTLGEHLRRILDPLGLVYTTKDGFLMITSKPWGDEIRATARPDEPIDDWRAHDPYFQYRDVLK